MRGDIGCFGSPEVIFGLGARINQRRQSRPLQSNFGRLACLLLVNTWLLGCLVAWLLATCLNICLVAYLLAYLFACLLAYLSECFFFGL